MSLIQMRPEQLVPIVGRKIVLYAETYFGQLRLEQYGSLWIIKNFSVYDPLRYLSSDPYLKLQGLLTISISPLIDLPQTRRIGFPTDSNFSWSYFQTTVRNL